MRLEAEDGTDRGTEFRLLAGRQGNAEKPPGRAAADQLLTINVAHRGYMPKENLMFTLMIDFANLLLAALVVGAMFGVWLFLTPARLDANSYVTVQQHVIRKMNTTMPALGAVTTLATIIATVLRRGDNVRLALPIAAAVCFVATGLITRFLNQPINAIVMTWHRDPPSNWTVLRDTWWRWHLIRLCTGLAGLSLLIAATLRGG